MAIGFGLLRLSPRDFWAMTPRELERAMSVVVPQAPAAMERGAFEALMTMYPDR